MSAALIIRNARLRTPEAPAADAIADTVAVVDGRIAAIGTEAEVRAAVPAAAEVIDARGGTLTPGLIDGHAHPFHASTLARGVDLAGVRDLDALRARLRDEADRLRGTAAWLRAWNLDYAAFAGRDIAGDAIEDAVHGMPAVVMLFDNHTAIATRAALDAAGVTGAERFADAGTIVVDAAGVPTGELREPSAYNRVLDHAPALTSAEERAAITGILAEMNRAGLTGAVMMDGTAASLDLFEELDETGDGLTLRLQSSLQHPQGLTEDETQAILAQRDRLGARWRGGLVKLFHDGVIDTGTAWLYEADRYGDGLVPFWPVPSDYGRLVQRYAAAGFQIATHAIGDRAIGETIAAYTAAGVRSAAGPAHRIEHLETLADADLARIAAAGITVSMQPLHMQWRAEDHSDAWADRLGPARSAKAWRAGDVLAAGALLALGSDWPVAQHDPRIGMAWARLRRAPGAVDAMVFEPEQRLSGEAALAGYTTGAAEAMGQPGGGRIAVGAPADLTLWDGDPVACPADELTELPVRATVVDGRLVHLAD
ncbi:amidohydrolase [Leucobacter sp. M11]|uniref:amidohydrolase n=1 Tax=Leucobacter sp. M11 TaxID=2993565 RepID=UPI002D7E3C30|nr:amidohydrolase family protein [Leucobacter sp. M11]MEB4615779.1 amidohydrolase family protein [Leucobacter sp. M11]